MNKYDTIHEAYLASLNDVYYNPDHVAAPRGQKTREKLNYQFTIAKPVAEPIRTEDPERNEVIKEYTRKETELYDSGSNRVEDFEKASKFWTKLANPDGTINSAYGHLIWKNKSHGNPFETEEVKHPLFSDPGPGSVLITVPKRRTPWEWCVQSLKNDKDTRQAVLRFSLPDHFWVGNKDQVCTLHGLFLIRDDKLNLTVNMRSNDLTLGLVYDLPWFISLMYKMADELKETYPTLSVGSYTHFVHSLHIYDRDEDKILKMLGREK